MIDQLPPRSFSGTVPLEIRVVRKILHILMKPGAPGVHTICFGST